MSNLFVIPTENLRDAIKHSERLAVELQDDAERYARFARIQVAHLMALRQALKEREAMSAHQHDQT